MNPEKKRYMRNRRRVKEIEGVDPQDNNFDCHHLVFRSDFADLKHPPKKMNGKGNLYALDRKQHEWIHRTIEQDGKITPEAHRELKKLIH